MGQTGKQFDITDENENRMITRVFTVLQLVIEKQNMFCCPNWDHTVYAC